MSRQKFGLVEIAQCLESTPERLKFAVQEQWGIKVWTNEDPDEEWMSWSAVEKYARRNWRGIGVCHGKVMSEHPRELFLSRVWRNAPRYENGVKVLAEKETQGK